MVKLNVEGTTTISSKKLKVIELASVPLSRKFPRPIASKEPLEAFNRRISRLMSPPPFQNEYSDASTEGSKNRSYDQDEAHPSVHFEIPE